MTVEITVYPRENERSDDILFDIIASAAYYGLRDSVFYGVEDSTSRIDGKGVLVIFPETEKYLPIGSLHYLFRKYKPSFLFSQVTE